MLKFLYGMLAGYFVSVIETAFWIRSKGYSLPSEIPNKEDNE